MSENGWNEYKTALIVGGIIFVVAFAMLLGIGDYGFIAALFLSFLLGLLSAIVYHLAFMPGATGGAARAQASTPAPSVPASAPAATSDADDAAARKKAEDKAAADEANRKAAEEKATADAAAAKAKADAEAAAKKAADDQAAAEAKSSTGQGEDYDGDGIREGVNEGTRPGGLDAPRNGTADDLKQIKGVGPKLEALLNRLGFWHFDQVAGWSADEVAWVDANLEGFKGRVSRDKWVEQAGVLASGGETDFSKRVEGGDVY